MATEQQHDATAAEAGTPGLSPQGTARRRFTRAGIAASGVLLTLHSQPGMAVEVCTTPSGSLSGGLHSFRGPPPTCAGRLPEYWLTASWPLGTARTTPFTQLFATGTGVTETYGAITQEGILTPQNWDTDGVGRLLVAAYLNVKADLSTFQTVEMLQTIWREYHATGLYTPTAGAKQWDSFAIAKYLRGTMA